MTEEVFGSSVAWQGSDCEMSRESDPLRQGDLLRRFVNGRVHSTWVIVTADCDIAQTKTLESGLACVELRPLRDYLLGEHLDRLISRQLDSRQRELREWVGSLWMKGAPDRTQLSAAAIHEWVMVASASEIVTELGITDRKAVESVDLIVTGLRAARNCRAAETAPREKLQALAQLQKKKSQEWRNFVHAQLSRLQSNQLPDDLFFITGIPNDSTLGYVAKLRAIHFVQWTAIVPTVPAARERSDAYARIARLAPTFKHGVAQQVGFLIAKIGFPPAYEAERDDIFDLVATELCDELGDPDD